MFYVFWQDFPRDNDVTAQVRGRRDGGGGSFNCHRCGPGTVTPNASFQECMPLTLLPGLSSLPGGCLAQGRGIGCSENTVLVHKLLKKTQNLHPTLDSPSLGGKPLPVFITGWLLLSCLGSRGSCCYFDLLHSPSQYHSSTIICSSASVCTFLAPVCIDHQMSSGPWLLISIHS